jgi:hypothetical protein
MSSNKKRKRSSKEKEEKQNGGFFGTYPRTTVRAARAMLSPNAFGLLWLRVQVLIFFLPVMNYANTHKYIERRSLIKKLGFFSSPFFGFARHRA